MKALKRDKDNNIHPFWGSSFIKGIPGEVQRLNESLGLELEYTVTQPLTVDGDPIKAGNVVFVIKKRPWFLNETYCLYALYEDGVLKGYTGKLTGKEIRTLKELGSSEDIENGIITLNRWIQSLLKASCDKV